MVRNMSNGKRSSLQMTLVINGIAKKKYIRIRHSEKRNKKLHLNFRYKNQRNLDTDFFFFFLRLILATHPLLPAGETSSSKQYHFTLLQHQCGGHLHHLSHKCYWTQKALPETNVKISLRIRQIVPVAKIKEINDTATYKQMKETEQLNITLLLCLERPSATVLFLPFIQSQKDDIQNNATTG